MNSLAWFLLGLLTTPVLAGTTLFVVLLTKSVSAAAAKKREVAPQQFHLDKKPVQRAEVFH
jgi:hypothetical protein